MGDYLTEAGSVLMQDLWDVSSTPTEVLRDVHQPFRDYLIYGCMLT